MKQTQALLNWPKTREVYNADLHKHTLVKFYRRRIQCACLDEKYEEVKSITKMGRCYNPECPIPFGFVERSKTMYCSRCLCVTYCSLGCQKADWRKHQVACDDNDNAAIVAKFDAKQQKS